MMSDANLTDGATHEPGDRRRSLRLALFVAALLTCSQAFAGSGCGPNGFSISYASGIKGCQEDQIGYFLNEHFTENVAEFIMLRRVTEVCTQALLYGSPEQDPQEAGVRMTPNAKLFLYRCGEVKGLIPKP